MSDWQLILGDDRRQYPNLLISRTLTSDDVSSSLVQYDHEKETTTIKRQFVCNSLPERFKWMPHGLHEVEKYWLIFQVLKSVEQLHEKGMVHGDIKPENFVVTSYDWLFLTDIHEYKHVLIDNENLEEYNKLYGYLDNNRRCYVAPEKWYSAKQNPNQKTDLEALKRMDLFSAGCVIYEILTQGEHLFDLEKLQEFRTECLKGKTQAKNEENKLTDRLKKSLLKEIECKILC